MTVLYSDRTPPSWNKRDNRGSDIAIRENWDDALIKRNRPLAPISGLVADVADSWNRKRKRGPVFGDWDHEEMGYPRRRGTYEECQAGRDPNIMNIADPCAGLPHGGIGFPQRPLPDFPGRPQPPIFDFPGTEGGYETLPYKPGAKMDPWMFLAEFAGEQLGRILGNS